MKAPAVYWSQSSFPGNRVIRHLSIGTWTTRPWIFAAFFDRVEWLRWISVDGSAAWFLNSIIAKNLPYI
jgi:hypothetical protein